MTPMIAPPVLRDEEFDATPNAWCVGLFREDAGTERWHDVEYDAWLDVFLNDTYEAWLDDWHADVAEAQARVADPSYVPFQDVAGWCSQLDDEIGYLESTAPYLF